MPRTPSQMASNRDEVRRQLIEAAARVFARAGFAGARMAAIAREAQLSQGLPYCYFLNKEEIYVAIVETAMQSAGRLIDVAGDVRQPPMTRLREICARMLREMQGNPSAVLITLQAASSEAAPERARNLVRQTSLSVQDVLASLIREAQALGQAADGDPVALACALSGAACGMVVGAAPARQPTLSADTLMRLVARAEGSPA